MSSDRSAPEGAAHDPDADPPTSILRRRPAQSAQSAEPVTGIIRRHPTGALPVPGGPSDPRHPPSPVAPDPDPDAPPTTHLPPASVPRSAAGVAARVTAPSPIAAGAAATAGIVNGWVTGVFATDLVTGWWNTDTLFSVAVAFLAAIVAACTIGGVVAVLLRRAVGRHLLVAGAALTLLVFGGIFLAGAQTPLVVRLAPALPVLAAVLALLPATRRYSAD